MDEFPRNYIVDERNRRVAVQLDIQTFEKLEELIENYGLVQLMKEAETEKPLSVNEARRYYKNLKKEE